MSKLTSNQQTILATWQQHTYAEFVLKDANLALATMTDNPYVFIISSGMARVGRAAVSEFYANKFLPNIPPDLEVTAGSQTFGDDRIVEELVMRFRNAIDVDWIQVCDPLGEEPSSSLPPSSIFKTAKWPASTSIGIRRRCSLSWASWIIRWRRPELAAPSSC